MCIPSPAPAIGELAVLSAYEFDAVEIDFHLKLFLAG